MRVPEAHAPFNFVPANDPIGWPLEPCHNEPTYSGTLTIEIDALEPILVSGMQRPGEARRFVMRNGRPYIPGSGLKGVVRSMLEALSMSQLHPISPRRVFFRDLKNPPYLGRFVHQDDGVSVYRSRAGYLRKEGGKWKILPCEWAKVSHDTLLKSGVNFFQGTSKPQDRLEALLNCALAAKGVGGPVPPTQDHAHPKDWNRNLTLRYRRLQQVTLGGSGRIVTAGHMGKRHFEAVFYEPLPNSKSISAHHAWDDFETWLDSHKPRRKLFDAYHSSSAVEYYTHGIPVFWIEASGSTAAAPMVEAFGYSQLFCVPYKQSVHALAVGTKAEQPLSLAEQIFGFADVQLGQVSHSRRGKVAFGAATCVGNFRELPAQRVIPGNPSATCIGLYLLQPPAHRVNRDPRNHGLNTYDNPEASLRGRKFYWHRPNAWGTLPPNPVAPRDNDNVSVEYAPLDKGVRFVGTVIVERLTKLELGALLAAVQLPSGHAHKIGLGKAFGLGSARLSLTSFNVIADRARYGSLRAHASGRNHSKNEPADFEGVFIQAIQKICGCSFESIAEIRELRAITNYAEAPPARSTAYMGLERPSGDEEAPVYANKPVLPRASEIAARPLAR